MAVAKQIKEMEEALDTIWVLLATMLVFFMHAGFSLLEAGTVRFKNTQNILAKNLIVVTAGFLCWYAMGWPLALSELDTPNKFAGFTNFFMGGLWASRGSFKTWVFQGAFCATGATIVSGSMAERTQLKGFGLYTVCMASFIYPVVAHWGWSGVGMLSYKENGVGQAITGGPSLIDFAGSGIVHLVGGAGALCGAAIVGARKGRFDKDTEADFDGHSVPFCVLGTFFLWFGWYGFNCGSTASMKTESDAWTAGLVAVNTTLAPCVAGLLVFFLRAQVVQPRLLDVSGFCNGILAGLVSITAGCSTVIHWEACLIGLIGGLVYQGTSMLMRKIKVDDVVDAFAVHGACGMWGVLACGFFGHADVGGNGLFHGNGAGQLGTQVFSVFIIALWSAGLSTLIMLPLRLLGMLRLSDETQERGADATEHSPPKAYWSDAPEAGNGAEKAV